MLGSLLQTIGALDLGRPTQVPGLQARKRIEEMEVQRDSALQDPIRLGLFEFSSGAPFLRQRMQAFFVRPLILSCPCPDHAATIMPVMVLAGTVNVLVSVLVANYRNFFCW